MAFGCMGNSNPPYPAVRAMLFLVGWVPPSLSIGSPSQSDSRGGVDAFGEAETHRSEGVPDLESDTLLERNLKVEGELAEGRPHGALHMPTNEGEVLQSGLVSYNSSAGEDDADSGSDSSRHNPTYESFF